MEAYGSPSTLKMIVHNYILLQCMLQTFVGIYDSNLMEQNEVC
jgi:hypothetical protein